MHQKKSYIYLLTVLLFALVCGGCGGWGRSRSAEATTPPVVEMPAAAPLPVVADQTELIIRELEERVKRNDEDFTAFNKLNGYYLQRAQETGDVKYLELADRAARSSLKVLPEDVNPSGLAGLAQSLQSLHDFTGARAAGEQLVKLQPRKAYAHRALGDALLELGDYDKAVEAYGRMGQLTGANADLSTEIRLARLDQLYGRDERATARYAVALNLALNGVVVRPETVAWCRWQLGEAAFAAGDYAGAEKHYRDALITMPDYYRAIVSLGRVRAAQGDTGGAIAEYEKVVKRLPDPLVVAALGDLYKLAGRDREASAQYALVEQIATLSKLNGALYNRQLALFYADHDLKPEEAYTLARREYDARRDIYGADALAWAALKAGKIQEAQTAAREALRLGTRDAKLFYHAGMIARAAGDQSKAREHLRRALDLNPRFDPLQAPLARKALAE
ncbi:MAG: tetratricopeptide repeat protein [Pyrinomonadaceae bacterium]